MQDKLELHRHLQLQHLLIGILNFANLIVFFYVKSYQKVSSKTDNTDTSLNTDKSSGKYF